MRGGGLGLRCFSRRDHGRSRRGRGRGVGWGRGFGWCRSSRSKIILDTKTKNTKSPEGPALHPSLLQRQQTINRRIHRVLPLNILRQAEHLPRRLGVDRRDSARAQKTRARGVEGRQTLPELRARLREVRGGLFPREHPAGDQEALLGCWRRGERTDVCGRDVAHVDVVRRELHGRRAPFLACDERVHHPVRTRACGACRREALDERAVDEWRVDCAYVRTSVRNGIFRSVS